LSKLVLHQYTDSPFSEKVRALLGFKALAYLSVDIPAIMPKPDLIALTGGYRRTPVLQKGADVFCDTALIAQVIEIEQPTSAIFGNEQQALASAAARWTDSVFFRAAVGLVFQPEAIAANPRFQDPVAAQAFLKDRADFTAGSAGLIMPLPQAEALFHSHLRQLDALLATRTFCGGNSPDILDFSTWHCCWFVNRQPVLARYFDDYPNVRTWMKGMHLYSDARVCETISGEEAIAIAKAAEPVAVQQGVDAISGLSAGDSVQVLPTDYGFQPVTGELLTITEDRISIARDSEAAGRLHVHFPRYGFDVTPAGDPA